MARYKSYFYIIDMLNSQNGEVIKKSLTVLPDVYDVILRINQGYIEIKASRNMTPSVKVACEIAQVKFRTEASERDILNF
jgi:hypothetical protein